MGARNGRLALAFLITVAGLSGAAFVQVTIGTTAVVGVMLLALILVAYYCGRVPALVAAVIYTVYGAFALPQDPLRIALFAVNGTAISVLVGQLLEAVRERQRTEARFETLFDASPLPTIIVRETDVQVVDVNDAFLASFGWKRDEILGRPARLMNLYPNAAERALLMALWQTHGRIRNFEISGHRKTGERRTLLVSVDRVMIDGVPHAQTLINDITEQRASEARFATVFQANPAPSSIVRLRDHNRVASNEAFTRLFGVSNDLHERVLERMQSCTSLRDCELSVIGADGQPLDVLASVELIEFGGERALLGVYKDITERKRADAATRESEARFHAITENIEEVFWITHTDQRVVYASPAFERVWGTSRDELYRSADLWAESIHPIDRDAVLEAVKASRRAEVDYKLEYRIVRPDGSVRWIRDRASPVRGGSGKVERFVGLAEDITDHRTLEEQLRQAQKMESLGLLAGGVAHDFNNLLAVIASCNGMLADEIDKTSSQRELVDDIDGAVNRATALTRQLLAFSRKQVTEPRVVDLNQIVNETRKMLRRMVGEDVIVQTSLDPDLGHVRVDPGSVVQVLMNLAVNARDAMPRGGHLTLTTRNTILTDDEVRLHPGVKAGRAIVLSVVDTGCGMTPEVANRIFEPFFTTKPMGRGTGMGLAVVHGIVDQAGGFIDVESQPGVGTTFRVVLPIVDARIDELDEIAAAAAFGIESILMVDDDDHVRRVAARALRTRGYTVIEASDGKAALDVLGTDGRVHLLLTDVVMPEMDGRQLTELAVAKQPDLKVLYMSGYTDDAVVRHGVLHGAVNFIEKPFRIDALAKKVRLVLDRDPAVSAGASAKAAVS